MKKICTWIIVLIMLCNACALADSAETQIIAAYRQAGFSSVNQLQVWANVATCIAERDGLQYLCVLEKRDESWQTVVCNPNALWQDEQVSLYLDNDQAVFWTYQLGSDHAQFCCIRSNTSGAWAPVFEIHTTDCGSYGLRITEIGFDAQTSNLYYMYHQEDENENAISPLTTWTLPGTWLGDVQSLANFDIERFPAMGYVECEADWPTRTYLRAAAEYLRPGYEYLNGAMSEAAMYLLMKNKQGKKVVIGYDGLTGATVESAALPDYAILGVENFTSSLGLRSLTVHLQKFPNDTSWGLNFIMGEDEFNIGKICVSSNYYYPQTLYVGSHPWSDVTRINWTSLPQTIEEAAHLMNSERYAVVANPDPADRLNLRVKMDSSSESLGKYYNGTPVLVLGVQGSWVHVQIGSRTGYMMKKYLKFGKSGQALRCDVSPMPDLQFKSDFIQLYAEPDTKTASQTLDSSYGMLVIGVIGNQWYHVWFPQTDVYGFIQQKDLWEGNG